MFSLFGRAKKKEASKVIKEVEKYKIFAGIEISKLYIDINQKEKYKNHLLISINELHCEESIEQLVDKLKKYK